jgi:ABC-type transport system involved in multi-copper enzyme maturation permease subunit
MIWLTWRQHRLQLLLGTAVLALLALLLIPSGFAIASAFRGSGLPDCLAVPGSECHALQSVFDSRYSSLRFTIPLFLILPALIGVFWGAPLLARESEQGTHRLARTQSVGRLRWTLTKLATLSAATVLGAALLAWLLSWWSRPS